MVETTTYTIASEDGEETLTVPSDLLDLLGEDDQDPETVLGDIAMLSLANRVHHLVHHHEGEADDHVADVEAETMDRFEERFGVTFEEATGHDH